MKFRRLIKQITNRNLIAAAFWCVMTCSLAAQEAGSEQAASEKKKSKWERSASLGLTVTQGNSDTALLTSNILGIRKWSQNEIRLGADGTYGEVQSTTSTESLHGFAQYNRTFRGDRAFSYARLDAIHDAIANVDYRLTLGPGAGYSFIKTEKTTLSIEVGPSYVLEKQGGIERSYGAVRLAERFERSLSERARIWQSLELLPQVDDLNNFLVNAELGIEADLTEKLTLRAFIQDTYDNDPALGRKENDLKLVTAIGYKF